MAAAPVLAFSDRGQVGAGLSQGAGLPGWSELLTPLADSIGLPTHQRADPLKVAQHYENKRGRPELINHVIEQTDATGKRPTDNQRRLARLGVRTWVTPWFCAGIGILGFVIIGITILSIAFGVPMQALSEKIVLAVLGTISGVLSSFIAVIYLKMFRNR